MPHHLLLTSAGPLPSSRSHASSFVASPSRVTRIIQKPNILDPAAQIGPTLRDITALREPTSLSTPPVAYTEGYRLHGQPQSQPLCPSCPAPARLLDPEPAPLGDVILPSAPVHVQHPRPRPQSSPHPPPPTRPPSSRPPCLGPTIHHSHPTIRSPLSDPTVKASLA